MEIEMENIQAIEKISVETPKDGGLIVFRGGQGTGKSTALKAIQKAAGGDPGKLEVRDGEKEGYARVGDCTVTIKRTGMRKKGEIVVDSIEGRLNLSSLVDPGIANPERADASRLKALLSLTGVKASRLDFESIIPEGVNLNIEWDTDDPIVLAGRVKRALEEHSRMHEKEAKNAIAKSQAAKERIKDVDLTVECDQSKLEAIHRAAVEKLIRTEGMLDAYKEMESKKEKAIAEIKELEKSSDGITVAEAEKIGKEARSSMDQAKEVLIAAEKAFEKAEATYDSAKKQYENAVSYEKTLNSLKSIVDSKTEHVSEAEICDLRASVDKAASDIDVARQLASAKADEALMKSESERAREVTKVAESFRKAAKSTDEVISKLIPDCPLRFKDDRLVISTDRSEDELFSDLSDGERYKVGINICADQLKEQGIMVIDQDAYEGLTESSRQEILNHLKARGVVAATAEAVDGELEVVVL